MCTRQLQSAQGLANCIDVLLVCNLLADFSASLPSGSRLISLRADNTAVATSVGHSMEQTCWPLQHVCFGEAGQMQDMGHTAAQALPCVKHHVVNNKVGNVC